MTPTFRHGAQALGLLMLFTVAAQAAEMLTDANGMTLYTFDKDKDGVSTCYDQCAVNWPPYLAKADEKLGEDWTTAARKDGAMQWVYEGKPVYFFKDDVAKGDAKGDGLNGVWHIITE